jgi:hypothetical protein
LSSSSIRFPVAAVVCAATAFPSTAAFAKSISKHHLGRHQAFPSAVAAFAKKYLQLIDAIAAFIKH